MIGKIRNYAYKVGAKMITKKAKAMDNVRLLKDKGSADPLVIIAILCIMILLVVAMLPMMKGIMTDLGNKASQTVINEF